MAVLTINGVEMPTPSSLEVKRSDLSSDETQRTQKGKMIKDRIGIVTTLSCAWKGLTWQQCSALLTEVEKNINMSVRYPCPKEGKYVTNTFYIGDRTAPALRLENDREMWEGVSFDFIEVNVE